MEAGLQFVACSLIPQYMNPEPQSRSSPAPALPTNLPRLRAIQALGLRDLSSRSVHKQQNFAI
jgi:hypothetical protein